MRKFGIMSMAVTAALLTAGQAHAATVLVVAGGGGGANPYSNGGNAQSGSAGSAGGGVRGGAGGTAGNGGAAGSGQGAGGGAGVNTGGGTNLGVGGSTSPSFSGGSGLGGVGNGGFGGGGGASQSGSADNNGGGGGGYSGGGGGADAGLAGGIGGGGGSYLAASLTSIGNLPSLNPGSTQGHSDGANGFITIDFLGNNAFSQTFSYTGALQTYTFSSTGQYAITAAGAQGGSSIGLGGFGALIGGVGYFTANSTLDLIVGGGGRGALSGGGGGGGSFVFQTYAAPDVSAVPEPASWAMMIAGFGGIGAAMRRRKVTTRVSYAH